MFQTQTWAAGGLSGHGAGSPRGRVPGASAVPAGEGVRCPPCTLPVLGLFVVPCGHGSSACARWGALHRVAKGPMGPWPRLLGGRCPTSLKMVPCEEGGGISLWRGDRWGRTGDVGRGRAGGETPCQGEASPGRPGAREGPAGAENPSVHGDVGQTCWGEPAARLSQFAVQRVRRSACGAGRRILALKGSAGANPPCPGPRDLWGEGWCVRSAHGVGSLRPRVRPAPGRRGPSTRAAAPLPHRPVCSCPAHRLDQSPWF